MSVSFKNLPGLDLSEPYTPYDGVEKRCCVICQDDESTLPLLKHGNCKSAIHYRCMNAWVTTRENLELPTICPTCHDSARIKWEKQISAKEQALNLRAEHPLNKWIFPVIALGAQLALGPYAGIAVAGGSAATAVISTLGKSTGRVAAGAVAGAALRELLQYQSVAHFGAAVAATMVASTVGAAIGVAVSTALKKAKMVSTGTINNSMKALESTVSGFKCGAAVIWGALLANAAGLI